MASGNARINLFSGRIALLFGWAILFLGASNIYSQKNDLTDSLIGELANTPDGKERVDLYVEICTSLYYTQPDIVMEYASEGYDLAEDLGYQKGLAECALFLGWGNRVKGNHPRAIDYSYQAREIGVSTGDKEIEGKALLVLATIQIDENNFQEAEKLFFQAKEKLMGGTSFIELGLSINGIGEVRRNRGLYDEALEAYEEATQYYEEAGFDKGILISQNNMGMVFLAKGEYKKCRELMFKAREKALETNFLGVILESSDAIAKTYVAEGELDKAIFYADTALKVAREFGFNVYIQEAASTLKEIYKEKEQYKEAMEYQEIQYDASAKIRIEATQNQIATLSYEHELVEKEKEIEVLSKDKQVRRLAIFTLVAILVLVLVMMVLQIRSNGQKNAANRLLSRQNERLEELNREKDSLVGIVAHDLKAPLTKVQSLARMLEMIGGLTDQQEDIVQKIEKVTRDGDRLIQDLLDITRAETASKDVHRTEFDLNQLVAAQIETHKGHASRKKIEINFQQAEKPVEMFSEESFISRIFDNLLSNALKYSPEGKQVEVTIGQEDGTASITVRDHGPGISEEDQVKMFRKFQKLSARPTGGESSTGLGLAIIKMLVESLGGFIEVESQLGEGAKFSVFIPTGK